MFDYPGVGSLTTKAARRGRAAATHGSPAERRKQLIDATIRSVANRGLMDTTIATVAREAGLSQASSTFISRPRNVSSPRRCASWPTSTGMPAVRQRPARTLARGRVESHGRARLPARDLRAEQARGWFCILGRAEVPPDLPPHLRRAGQIYDDMARTVHAALRAGGYTEVEPRSLPTGWSALTDGLWLDLLVRPESMTRDLARRIGLTYWPMHFHDISSGLGDWTE